MRNNKTGEQKCLQNIPSSKDSKVENCEKKKKKDNFSCKRFFKVTSHPLITFFPFQNNSQNSFIHYTTHTNCKTRLILYFRIHATSAIITSVVVKSYL